MENKSLPRSSRSNVSALIEPLERRQMLNAAVLRHGRLTVYCTGDCSVAVLDAEANPFANVVDVIFTDPMGSRVGTSQFRGTAITRLRIFGDGTSIGLEQTYTPNLVDVAIYAGTIFTGNGGARVSDTTDQHPFNRNERVSIFGGDGDDILEGGGHTVLLDGGAGNDTLTGGEAGATLDGGDGNDVLSANAINLDNALEQIAARGDALGAVALNGGAGDDVIVGNNRKTAGISDTLSGGGGNDIFYPFSTDQMVDFGVGTDQNLAANQFIGSAQVAQSATLSLTFLNPAPSPRSVALNAGNNGPNSLIYASDSNGTLTMHGPVGTTFSLGDLFNSVGYPFGEVPIRAGIALTVNGFASPLTHNQIAGYQINNGDSLVLYFGAPVG